MQSKGRSRSLSPDKRKRGGGSHGSQYIGNNSRRNQKGHVRTSSIPNTSRKHGIFGNATNTTTNSGSHAEGGGANAFRNLFIQPRQQRQHNLTSTTSTIPTSTKEPDSDRHIRNDESIASLSSNPTNPMHAVSSSSDTLRTHNLQSLVVANSNHSNNDDEDSVISTNAATKENTVMNKNLQHLGAYNHDDDTDHHTNDNDDDDEETIGDDSTADQQHDYYYTQRRMSVYVWKRKSGFTGTLKSGYVIASEKATKNLITMGHHLGKMKLTNVHLNIPSRSGKDSTKDCKDSGKEVGSKESTTANTNSTPSHTPSVAIPSAAISSPTFSTENPLSPPKSQPTVTATISTQTSTGATSNPFSPSKHLHHTSSNQTTIDRNISKMWERRRLVLDGKMLMYFHANADIFEDDTSAEYHPTSDDHSHPSHQNSHDASEESSPQSPPSSTLALTNDGETTASRGDTQLNTVTIPHPTTSIITSPPRSPVHPQGSKTLASIFIKKKSKNHHYSTAGTGTTSNTSGNTTGILSNLPLYSESNTKQQSAINTPRGVIDLASSRASSCAVHPSFSSPTPYILSVVSSDNKWMFCFDTAQELRLWLNSLTDVALYRSVETFNWKDSHSWEKSKGPKELKLAGNGIMNVGKKTIRGDTVSFLEDEDYGHDDPDQEDHLSDATTTTTTPHRVSRAATTSPSSRTTDLTIDKTSLLGMICLINISCLHLFYIDPHQTITLIYVLFVVNSGMACMWKCGSTERYLPKDDNDMVKGDTASSSSSSTSDDEEIDLGRPSNPVKKRRVRSLRGAKLFQRKKNSRKSKSVNDIETVTKVNTSKGRTTTTTRHSSRGGEGLNQRKTKPLAGTTTKLLKDDNETNYMKNNINMVSWLPTPPSSVSVRGADYMTSKVKIPSPGTLYELVELDGFEVDQQLYEISAKVKLPQSLQKIKDMKDASKTWVAPDILVVSISLPMSAPKLGRSNNDEMGYVLTGYYRMRKDTKDILRVITSSNYDAETDDEKLKNTLETTGGNTQIINAVKLWERWCKEAPNDTSMQTRFKFIARGDNLEKIGVPHWIRKYNGTPMLIKRSGETGLLFPHLKDNLLEFDVSMYPFPFLFKQAMNYLKEHYFPKMLMTFAFTIEGRDEEELPEVLLGHGIQIRNTRPDIIVQAKDFFSGTNPLFRE